MLKIIKFILSFLFILEQTYAQNFGLNKGRLALELTSARQPVCHYYRIAQRILQSCREQPSIDIAFIFPPGALLQCAWRDNELVLSQEDC